MRAGGEEEDEPVETEFVQPNDVPGYLLLPDELKDEGRLSFALGFAVSAEGVLHPEWIAVWSTINHVLKHREFPSVAEVTRLKIKE